MKKIKNNTSSVLQTYDEDEVEFIKGDGPYIFSNTKKKYLDFGSGIAVSSLGHSNKEIIKIIQEQSKKLIHTSNLYHNSKKEQYAKKLCLNSFADKVFFTNSGVEAIECGIKSIRKYYYSKHKPRKNKIITFEGGFHGRSIAAISSIRNNKHSKGFGPLLGGFVTIPFNDINAVKKTINENTAAILIEPIQGEGGIRPADIRFLRFLREITLKNDSVLFLDEVQSGFGRSGKFFSYEWADIKPDILAAAKGIGSGFPLGACLMTDEIGQFMNYGSHGSTFGGNHLAISVGNKVIDIILKNNFLKKVDKISRYMWKELIRLKNKYEEIKEIRGAGLLLGIKTKTENNIVKKVFFSNKLLSICASDNVIRLAPPLIINKKHVDEAIKIIDKSMESLNV